MSIFRKKEQQAPKLIPPEHKPTSEILQELNELKLQGLMKKVAEQEIIIRRLLELVVMNIENKRYDQMRPKIAAIQNLLDKR